MKYTIHKTMVVSDDEGKPIVLSQRTGTFDGSAKELKEHLTLFNYDGDQDFNKEIDKHVENDAPVPTPRVEPIQPDETPF